ncbi:M23 family peptidase [Arthrobacter sp. 24S4-2]|uniref:M23 family metallopeptidase n=1 Tax=Arthrobacter sp. 24S4-2 TaxID=2575374 RepID=UPI0010C7B687|nr:M23 family metallopeptidase [Arthrobacter sp. 24S4-2]QCO96906.1 M23 family peptidase [Arthrobacter sp. 24S4-2]
MCAVSTLSVIAFGLQGPSAPPSPSGALAAGHGMASAAATGGPGNAPSLPSAFLKPLGIPTVGIAADAHALLSFSRSDIRTTSKSGKHELNVASDDLRRPPAGSLMAPLEVLNETSGFGLRVSPLTGTAGEFHWGQDFAAACGTRVYAADAGVVRAVGWHPWGGGNRVEIDHGNGLITTYNHLEGIAVKKGESVQVGEVIAKVGTTGSSTGCHLHFETILNGKHVNPLDWKLLPIKQVDELGNIDMISYLPGTNAPAGDPTWAIPVSDDNSHTVTGGETEAPVPGTPSATPSATSAPTPSAPATASVTGTPTTTATPPPTAVPATATPTPPSTVTPSPTGTPPPTQAPTPTQTEEPTATATPSPAPTLAPTATAAVEPTAEPTTEPTGEPTPKPTATSTTESAAAPEPSDSQPAPTPTASATPTP